MTYSKRIETDGETGTVLIPGGGSLWEVHVAIGQNIPGGKQVIIAGVQISS